MFYSHTLCEGVVTFTHKLDDHYQSCSLPTACYSEYLLCACSLILVCLWTPCLLVSFKNQDQEKQSTVNFQVFISTRTFHICKFFSNCALHVDIIFCHTKQFKERGKGNNVCATACTSCGTRWGRPQKTTEKDGFQVGHNGGSPCGTTTEAGSGVSGVQPCKSANSWIWYLHTASCWLERLVNSWMLTMIYSTLVHVKLQSSVLWQEATGFSCGIVLMPTPCGKTWWHDWRRSTS